MLVKLCLVMEKGPQITKILTRKPPLSAIDLSLISWLEVLRNEQVSFFVEVKTISITIS